MAGFMLGSFTDGLFGGYNGVQDIMSKGEEYKRSQMETQRQSDMMGAAKTAREARERQTLIDQVNAAGARADAEVAPAAAPAAKPSGGTGRLPNGQPDLGSVPQPTNQVNTNAIAAGTTGAETAGPAAANAATKSGVPTNPYATRMRELGGYGVPAPQPQGGNPSAPVSTSPANMPTYDVPLSQPGAISSGQGTAQAQGVQTGPAPASKPMSLGPNLSQAMTNRPVGAAFGDWLHGRQAPPQYLPSGQQPPQRPAATPPTISGVPTNAATSPTLGNSQGGLGAQLLQSMNPGP